MTLELRPLNILIGANGAGKSNLVLFFKMLNEMMGGRLQQFIATSGRAQSLLHFGPKVTPQMEANLEFADDNGIRKPTKCGCLTRLATHSFLPRKHFAFLQRRFHDRTNRFL